MKELAAKARAFSEEYAGDHGLTNLLDALATAVESAPLPELTDSKTPCLTCNDQPEVCATVPGLRHCEKANREAAAPTPRSDISDLPAMLRDRDQIVIGGVLYCGPVMKHAADRIEQLERELAEAKAYAEYESNRADGAIKEMVAMQAPLSAKRRCTFPDCNCPVSSKGEPDCPREAVSATQERKDG